MKILRKIPVWLVLFALIVTAAGPWTSAKAAADPALEAGAAVVVDVKTGKTLYALNPMVTMYPAGLTKIMTTMLAAEAASEGEVRLSDKVVITEEMLLNVPEDYVGAELVAGEEITLEELMYCCYMDNADDAAYAIAYHISGSVDAFVQRMNIRASELGCLGTNFVNPTGAHDPNHYTTAEDMNRISSQAYKNATLKLIASSRTHTVPATNESGSRRLETTLALIDASSWYYAETVEAGKTAYSAEAGDCISISATNGVLDLVIVLLGAQTVTDEAGNTVDKSFTEAARIAQWAYDNFEYRVILELSDAMYEVPVEMGDGADSVIVKPTDSITQLMDKSISDQDFVYDVHIYSLEAGETLMAPVQAGDILGEVVVSYGDTVYGTVTLAASTSVALMHGDYLRNEFAKVMEHSWVRWLITAVILLLVLYLAYLILYTILRVRSRRQARERARDRLLQLRAMDRQAAAAKAEPPAEEQENEETEE